MAPNVPSTRLQRLPLWLTGSVLGLFAGAACSLTLGLDEEKACTADSECEYSDGAGSCVEGFCQPPGADGPDDGVDDGGTAGTTGISNTDDAGTADGDTTSSISDTSDDDSSGSDTVGADCTVNTDCNMDERCSATNECVSLLSKECTILEYPDDEDFDRDNVVFLGSVMPTGEPFDALVVPLQNAVQLAIEDFNNITSLPGNRQIAWVGCQSTAGANVAEAAAAHLVDNVGAPAIVGPVFSESVIQVADQVTVPGDTFLITPTGSAALISSLLDQNLVWRVTPSDVYQSEAIKDRLLDSAPARVLVLAKDDAYGNGILGAIQTDLITDLAPAEVYITNYENPAAFATQEKLLSSYGAVLGEAFATLPAMFAAPEDHFTHVVILGTSEAEALIVSYISIWAQLYAGQGAPLPRFVVSHGVVPSMEPIVENLGVAKGTEALAPLRPLLFSSIEGTSPDIFDPENFAAFNIRYKIRFMNEEALTSSSLSYDATLAALFAMVTVDENDPLTGTAIAEGMASLNDPDGTAVSFSGAGLDFIQTARNQLAAGATVDLQGVSGALNWDADTGELRANILGWELAGDPDDATINVERLYSLNPEPAIDGNWVEL